MATYTLVDSFTDNHNSSMLVNSNYIKIMQTFTTSKAYTLVRIGVWADINPYPNDVSGGIYSVSDGVPNVLLESFTMTIPDFSQQKVFALLDSPLELSSGVQYAIQFDYSSLTFYLYGDRDFDSDPYAGGEWLAYDTRDPVGWENPFGSAYANMYFETYSSYSLTPTPLHEATGIVLFPTLSWAVD